jgi:hypothetical protein
MINNHRARKVARQLTTCADVEKIDTLALEIRKAKSGPINLSRPIITLGDIPVIYPNTISMVQGKTGTHKSHIAQNIVSAVIAKESNGEKTMGFKCPAPSDLVVVYIDTERNYREQFPIALQSILTNAGLRVDANPQNFVYFSFVDIPRNRRLAALDMKLKQLREFFGDKHLLVVLDVITDFVASFNDEKESMKLIDILNVMCNRDRASVIGVIHENPGLGSDKARGHLGTELANKATTVLQTKQVNTLADGTEVFALNFTKFRNDRKPQPVFMQFDKNEENLIIVDSYKPTEEKVNSIRMVQNVIGFHLISATSKSKLLDKLSADTKLSKETVSKAIAKIIKDGLEVEHMIDGPGTIVSTKQGKEVLYRIEPKKEQESKDEITEATS